VEYAAKHLRGIPINLLLVIIIKLWFITAAVQIIVRGTGHRVNTLREYTGKLMNKPRDAFGEAVMARIIKPRRTRFSLPEDHRPYTDKYFIYSKRILKRTGVNPRVTYQVFINSGPGVVCGIDEAIHIIKKYAEHSKDITIRALYDGERFKAKETVMLIEGPVQDLIELETMYLGVISTGTSIATQVDKICSLIPGKDVIYFGARHWRFDSDAEISYAAYVGGAAACSTDVGAATFGSRGVGTMPHALVLMYGDTLKAAEAFADHLGKKTKVIALVDTFGREVTDALRVAEALGEKLYAIRLDTSGDVFGEPCVRKTGQRYWSGKGVTVELVRKVRNALNKHGFEDVKIVLSSGFNVEKVRVFAKAERRYGRLFDAVGTGSVFEFMFATSDIVLKEGRPCHKVGRPFRPNPRLKEVNL
jgi:nicotinate phosphoribosyltransferase